MWKNDIKIGCSDPQHMDVQMNFVNKCLKLKQQKIIIMRKQIKLFRSSSFAYPSRVHTYTHLEKNDAFKQKKVIDKY